MNTLDKSRQHTGAKYRDCATINQLQNINSRHFNGCVYCGYSPTAEERAYFGITATQFKKEND